MAGERPDGEERPVAVVLDDLLGERQVVLALEALADLGDVQLRVVLRVVVLKELQEPLRLLVDLFCAACGPLASAAGRFESRMQTSKAWRSVSSGTVWCSSHRCMFVSFGSS